MKIDYKHFFVFFLIFMIFQIILCISEINPYLNMISDIQGYKTNMFKNNQNKFTFRWVFIFTIFSFFTLLFVYYYIILPKKSLLHGFIFVSVLFMYWDINYLISFDKGVSHLPVLIYDTFVVGGLCMVISQYTLYNYYNILKNCIPLLFILYLLIHLFGFYIGYKYNPDLSNIKGVALF
jgi:hypothetical protein